MKIKFNDIFRVEKDSITSKTPIRIMGVTFRDGYNMNEVEMLGTKLVDLVDSDLEIIEECGDLVLKGVYG